MISKIMYCNNCGGRGHVFRSCKDPVISCGIILLREGNQKTKLPITDTAKAEILMVKRKDSMAFVEFVRGKYEADNYDYAKRLISNMTKYEQNLILNESFEGLWAKVWGSGRETTSSEFEESKNKFEKLNCKKMIKESPSDFDDAEWGFPKGRRMRGESDMDCAIREFFEETNIVREAYTVCSNISFTENFTGTNDIKYRHVYFVALLKTPDLLNITQKLTAAQRREISAIGWKTIDETKKITRPHYSERKQVLCDLERAINTFETLE